MTMNYQFKWLTLLVLAVGIGGYFETGAVTLDANGYNVVVAVSSSVSTIAVDERVNFLKKIKDVFIKASQLLFEATDNYLYFKTVDILLPKTWTNVPHTSPTASATYVNADLRIIETLKDDGKTIVRAPRTQQSKPCGQPGEYITVPPQFFLDVDQSTTKEYGDPAKVLIHEWAHYRYGVFEEYGFESDDKFPYAFVNSKGHPQITGCNNSEIAGSTSNYFGEPCVITDQESRCFFSADLNSSTGPTSSLMFMQFLPTATRFCNATNHDPTAPNKHNYWCRNRSVQTIIKQNNDMKGLKPLPPTTTTHPQFNYVTPASPFVYVVVDVATHDNVDKAVFEEVKKQLNQELVKRLLSIGQNTFIGIATMGGNSVNHSRLGGYLKYIQEPIQLRGNENVVRAKVNSLEQQSEEGLLVEKALLDVGYLVTPFTYQTGSIVLFIKLNSMTNREGMNTEWNVVQLLNSRNARLVTVEFSSTDCKRASLITDGYFFNCNSSNYRDQLIAAMDQVAELATYPSLQSYRMNLDQNPLTATASTPAQGFRTIDWKNSIIEINFYVPVDAQDYDIKLYDPQKNVYTITSPEYQQNFKSWNGLYNIHTFTVTSTTTGDWQYEVKCSNGVLQSLVDAVEILPQSIPITFGRGGSPSSSLIEIETFTSGSNGILNLGGFPEDNSFLIYVSIRKGFSVGKAASRVAAIIHDATGNVLGNPVLLKDDGQYPDSLMKDGIYTGYYKPPGLVGTNTYHISIQMQGYRKHSTNDVQDPYSYALPIDQGTDYPVPGSTSSFQRYFPFVTRLDVKGANYYLDKPLRIMDFQIDSIADDDSSVTLSWTAPAQSYLNQMSPVSSYRLVYSDVISDIITEYGFIPMAMLEVNSSDVLDGSLTPQTPGTKQSVKIRLDRSRLYNPLYFTIASKGEEFESYPAPIKFVPQLEDQPETTTIPSTMSSTSPSSISTTSELTSTIATTTELTTQESTTSSDPSTIQSSSTIYTSTASPSTQPSSTSPIWTTTPSTAVDVSASLRWILLLAFCSLYSLLF